MVVIAFYCSLPSHEGHGVSRIERITLHKVLNLERLSFHLIELIRFEVVDLGTQICGKLSKVLLADDDFLIMVKDGGCVPWQRIYELEMSQSHTVVLSPEHLHGTIEMSEGTAPPHYQQVGIGGIAEDLHVRHLYPLHLLTTQTDHTVVVLQVV